MPNPEKGESPEHFSIVMSDINDNSQDDLVPDDESDYDEPDYLNDELVTSPVNFTPTSDIPSTRVDTLVCSPDGTYVATLSSDGTISLWDFLTPEPNVGIATCTAPKLILTTEFKANNQTYKGQRFILALSVEGLYIAISSFQEKITEPKQLPLKYNKKYQAIFSTRLKRQITPYELENRRLGVITFLKDKRFLTCDGIHVRVYCHPVGDDSPDRWAFQYKLNISVFFADYLNPFLNMWNKKTNKWHRKTIFKENLADKIINIFGFEKIFWFEGKETLSLWYLEADGLHYDLNIGSLLQRFILPQHYEYIAIGMSKNNQLLATITNPKDPGEPVKLTVFFIESGLILSQCDVMTPGRQQEITFLDDNERILTYGPRIDENGNITGYIATLFDAYSARALRTFSGDEDFESINLFPEMPGIFVSRTQAGLQFWQVTQDEISDNLLEVTPCGDGVLKLPGTSVIVSALAKSPKTRSYSLQFTNTSGLNTHMCISQWQTARKELRACYLDNGRRVLIATDFLVIIFLLEAENIQPKLQFIWSVPTSPRDINGSRRDSKTGVTLTDRIDTLFLDINGYETTGVLKAVIHVLPAGSAPNTVPSVTTIILPNVDEDHTSKRIIQNMCISLALIRLKLTPEQFEKDELIAFSKDIIKKGIPANPGIFSRASNHIFPFREFIYANWDDIILDILEQKQYVPCFYNAPENTESALTLVAKLQKGKLVRALLMYYAEKARSNPQYMTLISSALPYLRYYPDNMTLLMKTISYNPTQSNSLLYQLPTEIRPGQSERSSKPEMHTFCLKRQRLPTGDLPVWIQRIRDFEEYTRKAMQNYSDRVQEYYLPGSLVAPNKGFNGFAETAKSTEEKDEDARLLRTHPALLCNVPLPGLSSYRLSSKETGFTRIWHEYIAPRSPFSREALRGHDEFFAEPVMEAVINFKWQRYARIRFMLLWAVQIIFFILFAVAVTVEESQADIHQQTMLIAVLAMAAFLILQEMRQFLGEGIDYFSVYNFIDLLAYMLPGACGVYIIKGRTIGEIPLPLISVSMILLWLQFILQLRIVKQFGIFLAIVFQIISEISYFLVLLALAIFAFAHSLFLLLRNVENSDLLPDYDGNLTSNSVTGTISLEQAPESDTNTFKNFQLALRSVYFFIDGEYGTIERFRDNPTLDVFKIAFSFLTGVILLNMLIAMMAEVYSKTTINGERAWLRQMATLIGEVEIYLMTPSDRVDPDLFPDVIYYEANPDKVESYISELESSDERNDQLVRENEKLLEKVMEKLREENKQLLLEAVREENEKWVKRASEWGMRARGEVRKKHSGGPTSSAGAT